jgi:hypothetical protein
MAARPQVPQQMLKKPTTHYRRPRRKGQSASATTIGDDEGKCVRFFPSDDSWGFCYFARYDTRDTCDMGISTRRKVVSTKGGNGELHLFLGFVSPGFVGFFWSLLLLNACNRYPPLEKSYEHCIKAMKARSVHSIVPSS